MARNETLGMNLLMAVSMVGGALDEKRREQLSKIKPDDWIPAEYFSDFLHEVGQVSPDKLRTIGRSMMYAGKDTFLSYLAPLDPLKVLQHMAQSYERTNRGPDMGYWKIISARPGFVELETTDHSGETFVEGLLEGAVRVSGGSEVNIEKRRARSRGDSADEFAISWEE